MADYDPDVIDEAEEGEEDELQVYMSKQQIIMLIDASADMVGPSADTDGNPGKTYVETAMAVAAQIMRQRIKFSASDELGVVFYGAAQTKFDTNQLSNVYEYLPLDLPDAQAIKQLEMFSMEEFNASIGSNGGEDDPARTAEDLRNGLWACRDIFSKKSTKANKTVMLFTNTDNPVGTGEGRRRLREQLLVRLDDLHNNDITLELYPLAAMISGADFDMGGFWGPLLAEMEGEEEQEELNQVLRVESQLTPESQLERLGALIQQRNQRRTALGSLIWSLSENLDIAVKLYALVQPAKVPNPIRVRAENFELTKAMTALVSADTGEVLDKDRLMHKKYIADSKRMDVFPPVIMTKSEAADIKKLRNRGLQLLGFKPLSCLQPFHQVTNAHFLYPDEKSLQGSTAAFTALHTAMADHAAGPQMAVARLVRREGDMPVLVALVVQEERFEEGSQATPPGMHVIYLPYQDDLRFPEEDLLLMKATPAPPRATPQQVEAAEQLISALTLEDFSCANVPNPAVANHYDVVERVALEEPAPERIEDATADLLDLVPEEQRAQAATAFAKALYGPGGIPQPSEGSGKGKKRKLEAEVNKGDAYFNIDWKHLAGTETLLRKQTMDTLKIYLRYHDLPVSGKKDDLVKRVQDHLLALDL